jgi:Phorbol esters/diacylglycerol binding domain (C1 domain)
MGPPPPPGPPRWEQPFNPPFPEIWVVHNGERVGRSFSSTGPFAVSVDEPTADISEFGTRAPRLNDDDDRGPPAGTVDSLIACWPLLLELRGIADQWPVAEDLAQAFASQVLRSRIFVAPSYYGTNSLRVLGTVPDQYWIEAQQALIKPARATTPTGAPAAGSSAESASASAPASDSAASSASASAPPDEAPPPDAQPLPVDKRPEPHAWVPAYFSSPTDCAACSKFVWGVTKQQQKGIKCSGCGAKCHMKCGDKANSMMPCSVLTIDVGSDAGASSAAADASAQAPALVIRPLEPTEPDQGISAVQQINPEAMQDGPPGPPPPLALPGMNVGVTTLAGSADGGRFSEPRVFTEQTAAGEAVVVVEHWTEELHNGWNDPMSAHFVLHEATFRPDGKIDDQELYSFRTTTGMPDQGPPPVG